jgi:hypothetical protein
VAAVDDEVIEEPERQNLEYINITTHTGHFGSNPTKMNWGATTPQERGPVIATVKHGGQRNAIGAHSGGYCIYTALAVAAGELNPSFLPNLAQTAPVFDIGPFDSWKNPKSIVTIDPWGGVVTSAFAKYYEKGYDIRPTIAVTKAHIDFPEMKDCVRNGRLVPDGKILMASGQTVVTKAAIEPVWYLPGVAERFGCTEATLRQVLIYISIHVYTRASHIQTYIYICTYTRASHMHTYVYTCIYTHAYIYTHIYIHTYRPCSRRPI